MSYNDKFYFEISKLFGDWKLEFEVVRDYLVKCIMSEVLNIAESNNGHCGVLELSVDVKLVSRHDFVYGRRFIITTIWYGASHLLKKEADHEILSMPCSHMFHEETSHYCPICRFEMPVEEQT